MSWYCEHCGPVGDELPGANYRGQRCPRCGRPLALARPADQTVTFACPGCHAEVDARSRRCGACGRWFGAPRCARCRAAVDPGRGECAECGAPLAPTTAAAALVLRLPCPVCDADLLPRALGSGASVPPPASNSGEGARDAVDAAARDVVLECPVCRGVMVEHDVVERWTADRAAHAPPASGDDALFAVLPGEPDTAVRYRRCPRCAGVMNRTNFAPGSGVVVDACRAHGIWFDPGELGRVLAFARSGRLDVARRRRAAEQADAKRRDAAAADRAMMSVITGGSNWEVLTSERRRGGSVALFTALMRWLIK